MDEDCCGKELAILSTGEVKYRKNTSRNCSKFPVSSLELGQGTDDNLVAFFFSPTKYSIISLATLVHYFCLIKLPYLSH